MFHVKDIKPQRTQKMQQNTTSIVPIKAEKLSGAEIQLQTVFLIRACGLYNVYTKITSQNYNHYVKHADMAQEG